MKTSKNNKPIKLTFETENFSNKVIGISSSDKIYKLSWEINNLLGIELSHTIEFSSALLKSINFSVFSWKSNDSVSFFLIENKFENTVLSSKYYNIDYFFVLSLENEIHNMKNITNFLKKSNLVQGIFILECCKDLKPIVNALLSQ